MTNSKNQDSKLQIQPGGNKLESHTFKQNRKKQNNDENVTNPAKMHNQKCTQIKDNLQNPKTTKIKQGNKRDLFDRSRINTTAILSDKYLSRPFQFFNEWEKQKGIQRHNKRHLANQLRKTQIRILKFGKTNLTREIQIRIMIQAQQKKNEKRQMTDRDRAEINT